MKQIIANVDVPYTLDYVRERSRTRRVDAVLATIPVQIRVLDADEAPIVLEARGLSGIYGENDTYRPFRSIGGSLACEALDWSRNKLGLDDLSDVEKLGEKWSGVAYPFGRLLRGGAEPVREAELKIKAVTHSGRTKAVAEAHAVAGRCAMIDGKLWVPAGLFVWDFPPGGTNVQILSERCGADAIKRTPFDIAHRDAAVAHGEWKRARDPRQGDVTVIDKTRIRDAAALPDIYLDLARMALGYQLGLVNEKGFTTVPVDVMDAWTAFRRAAAPVMSGEREAIPAAFEALRGVMREVEACDLAFEPEHTTMDGWSKGLPEVLHWNDTYLAGLAPALEAAEAESLAL